MQDNKKGFLTILLIVTLIALFLITNVVNNNVFANKIGQDNCDKIILDANNDNMEEIVSKELDNKSKKDIGFCS